MAPTPTHHLRYCTHPGCSQKVRSGYCAEHQPQVRATQQRFVKGNYGRPWRRIREQFLHDSYPWFCAIKSPHCEALNQLLTKDQVEVDHIVPHRGNAALRDDMRNLQISCKSCHSVKTATEVGWGSQR